MKCLKKILFEDLCLEDDSFHIRMRKAVVAVGLPVGTIVFLALSWLAIQQGLGPMESVAGAVFLASRLLMVLTLIGAWVYARATRSFGDRIASWYLLLLSVSLTAEAVTNYKSPVFIYQLLLAGFVIMFQVPYVCLVAPCLGALINVINLMSSDGNLLTFPGSHVFDTYYDPWPVVTLVAVCAFLFCIHVQSQEFSFLLTKSAVGVQMAKDVSDKLVAYETAEALDILRKAQQSAGTVDAGLTASCTASCTASGPSPSRTT